MPLDAASGPRRIALFFSSFGGGGIERSMLELAEGFVEQGLAVDLVVVTARGPLRPLVPVGADVTDLRSARTWRSLPGLVRYFRRVRPAAVVSAQTHVNLVATAAKILAGLSARLVLTEHIAIDAATAEATRWQERLFPVLARVAYRYADRVVVVSRDAADRFAETTRIPRDRVSVIYNPIVTPRLMADAAQPVDHPWFAAGACPVILSVGRLVRQKDHRTLLEAFARVRTRRHVRLMILGEGEERPSLETLARDLHVQDDVALPGFILNPASYMTCARLFALSSRWEGFANALVEAMACGVPVVSTDCPSGPAEVLEGGRYGRLVPVGDAAALAEAMINTLSTPPPAEMLRARAMEFTRDRAVRAYLAEFTL